MVSLSSSYCSMVGFLALLGCLLLSCLENNGVQALSSSELYERDLRRLSKLRMERRLDADSRLRPRASVLPPPPVFSASIPDTLPFSTCPTIVGLGGSLNAPYFASFRSGGSGVFCSYPSFDGRQPMCFYSTASGLPYINLSDGSPTGIEICGSLL